MPETQGCGVKLRGRLRSRSRRLHVASDPTDRACGVGLSVSLTGPQGTSILGPAVLQGPLAAPLPSCGVKLGRATPDRSGAAVSALRRVRTPHASGPPVEGGGASIA